MDMTLNFVIFSINQSEFAHQPESKSLYYIVNITLAVSSLFTKY